MPYRTDTGDQVSGSKDGVNPAGDQVSGSKDGVGSTGDHVSVSDSKDGVNPAGDQLSGSKDCVGSTGNQVTGSKDGVGSTAVQVSGSKDGVGSTGDQVSGSKDGVGSTGDQVLGSKDGVGSTGDQVSGSKDGVYPAGDQLSGSKDCVGSTGNQVSGSKDGVGSTGDQVLGSKDGVGSTGDQVSGSKDGVYPAGDLVSGSKDGVGSTRDQVSGSKDCVGSTRDQVSGSKDGVNPAGDQLSGSKDGVGSTAVQVSGSKDGVGSTGDQLSGSKDGVGSTGDQVSGSKDGVGSTGDQVSGSKDEKEEGGGEEEEGGEEEKEEEEGEEEEEEEEGHVLDGWSMMEDEYKEREYTPLLIDDAFESDKQMSDGNYDNENTAKKTTDLKEENDDTRKRRDIAGRRNTYRDEDTDHTAEQPVLGSDTLTVEDVLGARKNCASNDEFAKWHTAHFPQLGVKSRSDVYKRVDKLQKKLKTLKKNRDKQGEESFLKNLYIDEVVQPATAQQNEAAANVHCECAKLKKELKVLRQELYMDIQKTAESEKEKAVLKKQDVSLDIEQVAMKRQLKKIQNSTVSNMSYAKMENELNRIKSVLSETKKKVTALKKHNIGRSLRRANTNHAAQRESWKREGKLLRQKMSELSRHNADLKTKLDEQRSTFQKRKLLLKRSKKKAQKCK
ncbi:Hypp9626 [Branchiostoma lanceolatum]|uniref:Hypp9626 protein n=1 Tax=Branchiostoma lanceolatum TaxID=7740 RepID=A0A8S4MND3_BRALA|nr:Hypp9626 [Branchiostoma lanceolatum]